MRTSLLLLFLGYYWFSQAANLDSLYQVLHTTSSDSQRMVTFTELGFAWWDLGEIDSARFYFGQAISYADQLEISLAQGQNRRYVGMLEQGQSDIKAALEAFLAANLFLEKEGGMEWMKLLVDVGNMYYYQANYPAAIETYQKADSVASLFPNEVGLQVRSLVAGNLGSIFLELHQPHNALKYQHLALDFAREMQDERSIGTALHNLGGGYETLDSLIQAKHCYVSALKIAEDVNGQRLQSYCHSSLGSIMKKEENLDRAIYHAQRAYELATTEVDEVIFLSRWGYYLGLESFSQIAEDKLKQALAQSKKIGLAAYTLEILGYLETVYAKAEMITEAYTIADKHTFLADSLRNIEIQKKIQDLELKYQTEQKEKENLRLKAENEIQKGTLRQQTLILIFSGLLLLTGALGFYFFQKSQKDRRVLAEQTAHLNRQRVIELEREQQMVSMRAMVAGQETERSRLAKELHDGLGGLLSTIRLQMSQIRDEEKILQSDGAFAHANDLLDKASRELRQVAHNLMPQALVKFGLQVALEDFISDVNQSKGLMVELQVVNLDQPMPEGHSLSIYRIIQELVNNVLKHAQATEALVQVMRRGQRLYLTVEDNGVGFDPQKLEQPGIGLENIRSRVEYLNGSLEIDSRPDQGTSVYIELDLLETPKDLS